MTTQDAGLCEEEVSRLASEIDEALAERVGKQTNEIQELKADRDEWRTQHENLLGMYRAAESALAALETETDERLASANRAIADLLGNSMERQETLAVAKEALAKVEADLRIEKMAYTESRATSQRLADWLHAERTRTAALEGALGNLVSLIDNGVGGPSKTWGSAELAAARALLPAKQAEGAQPQEGK